jgi:hypothetical protein
MEPWNIVPPPADRVHSLVDSDTIKSLCSTRAWLRKCGAELQQREFSERWLQCLFGIWILDRALGQDNEGGYQELATITSGKLVSVSESEFSSYDAKLLLTTLYILRKSGCSGYVLENYADKLSNAFQLDESARDNHVGEALMLSHLGLGAYPSKSHVDIPTMGKHELGLLHSDPAQIRSWYSKVCNATYFGTRKFSGPFRLQRVEYLTKVLLIDAFREYDLSTGAILLRAAAYLNLQNEQIMRNGRSFLKLQQLSNGRFGQYDLVAQRIEEAGFDASWDLYLPLTVSCVWALVETTIPNFRVFCLPAL